MRLSDNGRRDSDAHVGIVEYWVRRQHEIEEHHAQILLERKAQDFRRRVGILIVWATYDIRSNTHEAPTDEQ